MPARKQQNEMLTLAAIRRGRGKQPTQYLFNEKPEIFTFRSATKTAETASARLKDAYRKGVPVKARLDTKRGFIQGIQVPTAEEVNKFKGERVLLDKPSKPRKIDIAKIDPMKFNFVDYYQKFPPFKLCLKTIPNYQKAKEVFDFCADQSCHLPGPYDISPCIPFQYVRDGCYARAHKMRWIITNKYKYCCEKVFSFANQGNDSLAVTANKWGGCCVYWWYHVAPLVRVKIKLPFISKKTFTLAMVIDPSMFDKPVLLSSWLAAQEKTVCTANAKVSMYSIQPGSAYWPASYDGTSYGTDPNYTQTDATLNNYKNLITCT